MSKEEKNSFHNSAIFSSCELLFKNNPLVICIYYKPTYLSFLQSAYCPLFAHNYILIFLRRLFS